MIDPIRIFEKEGEEKKEGEVFTIQKLDGNHRN